MKKVINRKVYDTDKADEICSYSNPYGRNDFHFVRESLYRTKNGSWFLAGEGGSLSKYAESAGQNSWCGGSRIIPLSDEETIDWLERYGDDSHIEQYFPDSIQEA